MRIRKTFHQDWPGDYHGRQSLAAGSERKHAPENGNSKAKEANILAENIQRAIQREPGIEGAVYEEIMYEGYAPAGWRL